MGGRLLCLLFAAVLLVRVGAQDDVWQDDMYDDQLFEDEEDECNQRQINDDIPCHKDFEHCEKDDEEGECGEPVHEPPPGVKTAKFQTFTKKTVFELYEEKKNTWVSLKHCGPFHPDPHAVKNVTCSEFCLDKEIHHNETFIKGSCVRRVINHTEDFLCKCFTNKSVCEVGQWTGWDVCSKTCGGGHSTRSRTVSPEHCSCVFPTTQTLLCNIHLCPQECELSEWGCWSACTVSCGEGGERWRERFPIAYEISKNGTGNNCGSFTTTEKENCSSSYPCPEPCVVEEWGEWSSCGEGCGQVDIRRRERNITEPVGNDTPCPPSYQQEYCVQDPCDPKSETKVELIPLWMLEHIYSTGHDVLEHYH